MPCDSSRTGRRALVVCAGLVTFFFSFPARFPAAQEDVAAGRVVIAVVGDVLPESSWLQPRDASHLLDGVRAEFARADLVFANLEEPITSSDTVTPDKDPADIEAGRDFILRAHNSEIPT